MSEELKIKNINMDNNLYLEIVDTRIKLEEILRENNAIIKKVEQEEVKRIVCENKRLKSEDVIHSLKDELELEIIISRQLKEQLDSKRATTVSAMREEEDTAQITDGGSNEATSNSVYDQKVDRKEDFDVGANSEIYENGYQNKFKMWIENCNNELGVNSREEKNQEDDVTGEARNVKLNQYVTVMVSSNSFHRPRFLCPCLLKKSYLKKGKLFPFHLNLPSYV